MSDRNIAKLFLTLSLFAGLTLAAEVLMFKLQLWGIVSFLVVAFSASSFLAHKAFSDTSGEMGYQTEWTEPRFEYLVALVILFLAGVHSFFYLYESLGSVVIRNVNLNGDLPFHWQMTRYLQNGFAAWPENPLFTGEPLRYAFGVNWISALALRTGIPFGVVFGVPLLLMIYVLWQQLWKWGGLWGVIAFFCSGGGWLLSLSSWPKLWGIGNEIVWKNLFVAIFETQRGFWLALPLGVFLLRLLFEMDKNPAIDSRARRRVFFMLWAFLPFFHLHTFVVLTLFSFAFVLTGYLREQWREILKEGLWFVPVPLFFIGSSISKNNVSSSVRVVSNWMSDAEPLMFSWVKNFGPWLMLILILFVLSALQAKWRGRRILSDSDTRSFWIWLSLGVIFSHVMLAPWSWDQSKIILWIYLGLTMSLAKVLREFAPRSLSLAILIIIFLPGIVQFYGALPQNASAVALWQYDDQRAVEVLVSELPVEERILVAPSPHHPILSTGRPIVAGYAGHLWSQGIDINGVEDQLRNLVLKQDKATFTPKYLIWGPLERRFFGVERPPGESKWLLVKTAGGWELYSR